jgi:hypothetical protein
MYTVTDLDNLTRRLTTGSPRAARTYFEGIINAGGTPIATFRQALATALGAEGETL